jgi:hypothetical protein
MPNPLSIVSRGRGSPEWCEGAKRKIFDRNTLKKHEKHAKSTQKHAKKMQILLKNGSAARSHPA